MQQINLYLPEFQPNREPMRSIHMLWGLLLFVILLLVVSVLSHRGNQQRELTLEQTRAQLAQRQQEFTELERQRPRNNLAELDALTVNLEQELQRREQILNIIANKKLGNNTGYSAHLQALANQSLDSISLQAFSLWQGGNYVEFAGQTRAADQVPLYIQQLRTQPAFAQSAFGVLHIKPRANGVLDFSLIKQPARSTEPEPKTAVQRVMELNEQAAAGGQ